MSKNDKNKGIVEEWEPASQKQRRGCHSSDGFVKVKKTLDIGLMNIEEAFFSLSDGGFLCLEYKEKKYGRVGLRRIMPQSMPFEYISIVDDEQQEICIIRDINELAEEQANFVRKELAVRYYTPRIISIDEIKDNMGFVYIDANLNEQKKNITVKDVSKNIKLTNEKMLVIFDVDGNRYIIDDVHEIDKKSLHLLGPYLF